MGDTDREVRGRGDAGVSDEPAELPGGADIVVGAVLRQAKVEVCPRP